MNVCTAHENTALGGLREAALDLRVPYGDNTYSPKQHQDNNKQFTHFKCYTNVNHYYLHRPVCEHSKLIT